MNPEQNPTPLVQEPKNHNHKFIFIFISVFTLLLISAFCVWYFQIRGEEVVSEVKTEVVDGTADWKTYRNEQYGFEFKYPQEWLLQTYKNPESRVILSVNNKTYNNKDLFFTIHDFGPGVGTQTIEKWRSSHSYSDMYFREVIISGDKILEDYQSECAGEHGQCSNSIVIGFNSDKFFQRKLSISLYIDDEEKINNSDIYNKYRQEVETIEKLLSTFKFIDKTENDFLYPSLDWKKDILDKEDYFKVISDNGTYRGNAEYSSNEYQPAGVVYVTKVKLAKDERIDFYGFYQKYFEKNNWVSFREDVSSLKISLTPASADGVTGGVWGAFKIDGDKVKYIGLSSNYLKYNNMSQDGPMEISCPCEVELKVFISDEFSLDKLKI